MERAIPDAAGAVIVRAMSAYMQAAKPLDLPASLRPLKGKHLKMLNARRADILGALDDEGLRAMVLEWLGDNPSGITKADAKALAIAAGRDEGWVEALAKLGPSPVTRKSPPADATGAVERERDKARKARDEVRRAKQAASLELARRDREAGHLRDEIASLQKRLDASEKRAIDAENERDAARAEMEREVRKSRRKAEKAEAALGAQKQIVKELRAKAATQPAAPPPPKRKRTVASPRVPPAPAVRVRLPVPKGRLAEDPETLVGWLSTPAVTLLVDGYNVSKARGGFGDLRLDEQRDRLLQQLGILVRRHKVPATIVFDGSHIPPGTSRRARGPVDVEYSRPDEIADDHLIAKLEALELHPVVVVTNDRELQHRAARLGATIATSNQLLALIR